MYSLCEFTLDQKLECPRSFPIFLRLVSCYVDLVVRVRVGGNAAVRRSIQLGFRDLVGEPPGLDLQFPSRGQAHSTEVLESQGPSARLDPHPSKGTYFVIPNSSINIKDSVFRTSYTSSITGHIKVVVFQYLPVTV